MSKALLITNEVLANLEAYEKARYEYIIASGLKRENAKKAENIKKSYLFNLETLKNEVLASVDKNDESAIESALATLAVREDFQKIADNMHAKMLEFERKDNQYAETMKSARESMRDYSNEWVSDALYESYIAKKDCVDFKAETRNVVTRLGFGRVNTADDKPFKTFCDKIQFQRKIDRKHLEQHTTTLSKSAFKELLIGMVCDYVLEEGGYYLDNGTICKAE